MFFVSALSLVGTPPLSGFISKFALIDAGIAEHRFAIVAVALIVSLLTLFSMMRIWMGAFWSPPEDHAAPLRPRRPSRGGGPVLMVAPTAALVACSLVIAAAAGPIYALSERTARELLNRNEYVESVLER
jgi:multicomponent Na+:H+ antiporter subunit D